MASGGVLVESEDFLCPICFGEFDEPKCLPSCAHNVCLQCLEKMARTNPKEISCPVCRKVSMIPPLGGVSGFPKNHLLANLVDRIPGRKEKQVVTKMLKKCDTECEEAKECLTELRGRFEAAQAKADGARKEIKSIARQVTERVQQQERDLLAQVDDYMAEHFSRESFEKHEKLLENHIAARSKSSKITQAQLAKGDIESLREFQKQVLPVFDKSSEASAAKIKTAGQAFKAHVAFTLSKPSESVENFVKDGFIGKLQTGMDFSNCGHYLWSIDEDNLGQQDFRPFAVAVSSITGHLAILEESKMRVHIVDILGQEQLKSIKIQHGELWDVAFNKDDEVVVTNRAKNWLLHYQDGWYVKRKVDCVPSDDFGFTFISIDSEGRYIVTSKDAALDDDSDCVYENSVCVYDCDRQMELVVGDYGELWSPGRAVSHKSKFYVPDAHRRCIVVFDEHGLFSHEIGKPVLKEPLDLAIDPVRDNILVADGCNHSVKIFSLTGTFVFTFSLPSVSFGRPQKIALSKDGEKIIVLFNNEVGIFHYLQNYPH